MAPHDTNTPREARRHAVPLIVMGLAVVLVLIGFVWWFAHMTRKSDTPGSREPGDPIEQTVPAKPNP